MSDITTTGLTAWRLYEEDGVPSSGAHRPTKAEIAAFIAAIEEEIVDAGEVMDANAETLAARDEAVEAAANVDNIDLDLDDEPGTGDTVGQALDAVGGEIVAPMVVREFYGNLSHMRDAVTKSAAPRARVGHIWSQKGQSLVIRGGTYTPDLINTSALYPDNVLMPSTGMWTNGRSWEDPTGAVDEYYGGFNTSLGSDPTGATASIAASFWNGLYERILAATDIEPIIAGYVEGAGGTSIQDLGPGTDSWEAGLRNLQRYRDWGLAQASPIRFEHPGVIWIHGNEDLLTMSGEQYMAWLIYLQAAETEASRRILGQARETVYYIEQNTGAPTSFATMYQVVDAQRELCRRLPDKFRWLPASYDLLHPDSIHMDSYNYHIRDQRQAMCVFYDYYAGGRPPFQVVDAWWTGATTLRMEVYVPTQPLVLDTTGIVITTTGLDWSHGANGYGLEFDDGSGASPYVTSIAVVNDGQSYSPVTITSASPGVLTTPTPHGQAEGAPVFLTTTGALYTGLSTTAAYFVKPTGASTMNLSPTPGGAAITTSGSQSGVHTLNIATHRSYIDVTLSGTPSSLYRRRMLIGARAAPAAAQGPVGGGRTCFRDSSPGVSTIDREGDTADYPLYLWMARQEVRL